MGTNYYLSSSDRCTHCGHDAGEELHIGKSSGGWCFSLHVIPNRGINSLDDWRKLWNEPGRVIRDKYQTILTPVEMEAQIVERGSRDTSKVPMGYGSWDHFHSMNGSEPGPQGLLRHALGGKYSSSCIGHGPGPYDYITGDFS